jgi:hypothetical protein
MKRDVCSIDGCRRWTKKIRCAFCWRTVCPWHTSENDPPKCVVCSGSHPNA